MKTRVIASGMIYFWGMGPARKFELDFPLDHRLPQPGRQNNPLQGSLLRVHQNHLGNNWVKIQVGE